MFDDLQNSETHKYYASLLSFKKNITFAPSFVQWCNGNTADFGSVVQGSSPCWTT